MVPNDVKRPSDFSLIDPKVQECPYEFYASMRTQDPVYQMPETGFYIVSRYADCMEALGKPEIFSSKMGFRIMEDPPEVKRIFEAAYGDIVDTLVTNDPPSHTRFRKLVNTAFTAARVAKMAPYIEQVVLETLEQIAGQPEIDIVKDYAIPIPMKIIADQLGVSRNDMDRFKIWSDASVEPLGGMIDKARYIEVAKLIVEMQQYFAQRIEERRAKPSDDMLSDLVNARLEGERPLDLQELLSVIQQLLVAGNETTTNTISSGVLMLCRDPQAFAKLRASPELCGNFAEEILRLESPVQGLFRKTTQDTVLGGKKIPKGAMVNLRYGSANRDEAKFECPADIKLDRSSPRSHLAFAAGIHTCIGAQLARKEIEVAMRALATRLKGVRLSSKQGPLEYYPSLILRGLKSLRVELDWA
jgi:cytochrome P450